MAIAITFVDATTGTGGVATVAGSAVGSTNDILAQRVDPTGQTTPAFTQVGTRVGDGTVALTLASGFWWLAVQNTSGGNLTLSNVLYARVTDALDAVASRCADALAARLAALAMTATLGVSVPSERVVVTTVPVDGRFTMPAILVVWDKMRDSIERANVFGHDCIGFCNNVLVIDRNDGSFDPKRPDWLRWREQVWHSLRHRRLTTVPENIWVRMEASATVDFKLPAEHVLVMGFVARCVCLVSR